MAETASLKRPHEDTEETKESTNGSERLEVRHVWLKSYVSFT